MATSIDILNVPKNSMKFSERFNIFLIEDGTYAKVVPGYFTQQEIMSQIQPNINLAEVLGVK